MKYIPENYQAEDIDFLLTDKIGGLLEDMGLGKTGVVLSVISQAMFDYMDTNHVIVMAPKTVMLNQWPSEIKKWDMSKDIPFTILHGPKKDVRLRTKYPIYLINFEGLPWLFKQYCNKKELPLLPKFDMWVIDESTHVKNTETQRYRIIKALFQGIKRKVILTGTPTPQGLIDLYGQISLLDSRILGTGITSYRSNYFNVTTIDGSYKKYTPRKCARNLITKRIAHLVKVRREEDHVDREKIKINKIFCDFSDKRRKEYDELERNFFLELDDGTGIEAFNSASRSNKLRQYTQGFLYRPDKTYLEIHKTKLHVLKELLESANGRPMLCATQFLAEVDIIRKFLGYNVPAVNSRTKSGLSSEHMVNWNKGRIPLLLAHPGSLAYGVNLQFGGHIIVWLALPWESDKYWQFNKRLDRRYQEMGVIAHHIMIADTIDRAILLSLENKSEEEDKIKTALKKYREERGLV